MQVWQCAMKEKILKKFGGKCDHTKTFPVVKIIWTYSKCFDRLIAKDNFAVNNLNLIPDNASIRVVNYKVL